MKKLIWGCTQMIVGMLGVIASLIFFVFGSWGWLSDALQVISFILLFLCAFVVFRGYFDCVRPALADDKTSE